MTEQKKRTIQVKIGNQAAKTMTPDQAADYLKSIAGKGWGNSRELKMTFDNGNTSSVKLPREKKIDNLCSEKEMKALMSMFVEIMGLQMNTEYLNNYPYKKKSQAFSFPADVPPPPGGWPEDLMWPDESQSDDESLPELEDIPQADKPGLVQLAQASLKIHKKPPEVEPDIPVTNNAGISPFEWTQLERTAIEDALEQEERIRKEKPKPKAPPAPTPEPQPVKKTKKEIISWRNKVANAVHSNDETTLESLLKDSPLPDTHNPHLEFLIPLVAPKNLHNDTIDCRLKLLLWLNKNYKKCLFENLRNGRSCLHSACFYGDVPVLDQLGKLYDLDDKLYPYCQESGYTSLFYACLSGNLILVERVLQAASDPRHLINVCSNAGFTWKKGTNKGINVIYLLDAILSDKVPKMLETHGMAITELPNTKLHLKMLQAVRDRLNTVLTSGYKKRADKEIKKLEKFIETELEKELEEQRKSSNSVSTSSATPAAVLEPDSDDDDDEPAVVVKKPKKKKKKKKKQQADSTSEASTKPKDDPLVVALQGMGFEEDQIITGIEACGGRDRATADTVVAWIFKQSEQNEKGPETAPAISREESERRNLEAAKQKQEEKLAAERLAAKREEQRRRNREWNNRQKMAGSMEATKRPASSRPILPARAPSPTYGGSAASSTVQKSTPTATRKTVPSTRLKSSGHLNLGPMGLDRNNSTDETTEVSSVDHGTIEVVANDDATVSTMGSFPAMSAPAPSFAPPGFNSSSDHQWEPVHRTLSDSYNHASGFNHNATPEIPETGPLLHSMPNVRSHSFSTSYGSSGYAPGSSLLGGAHLQAPPPQGSSFLNQAVPSQGSSLLNQAAPSQGSSLLNPGLRSSYPSQAAGQPPRMGEPVVPGLLGLNATSNILDSNLGDLNPHPRANSMDQKLVESMATGQIGGSALWDTTADQGTSLLGSLLSSSKPTSSTLFGTTNDQWAGQVQQQNDMSNTHRNRNSSDTGGSIW